jgi:hypothetical protein
VNVERLVELVIRALTAENQIVDVHQPHRHGDRVAVTVVDVDRDRWRLHVLREPWAAPA